MAINSFEAQLSGGHPNSLGNTVAVVEEILKNKKKLKNLYDCYQSEDEVVRLRVSSAMKRVCIVKPEWVADYLDGLLSDISQIDQASTKWTLAILFRLLDNLMNATQRKKAIQIMKTNLINDKDWIVQNTTAESLEHFSINDKNLKKWLMPELTKMIKSKHKSVAHRAAKILNNLRKFQPS